MSESATKRCPSCGETKPRCEFYGPYGAKRKLSSFCRICQGRVCKAWRKAHPDKHREAVKRRVARSAASEAVRIAVRAGHLVPAEHCEDCGRDFSEHRRAAHHHKSYAKEDWYEVRWLCTRCHGLADRKRKLEWRAAGCCEHCGQSLGHATSDARLRLKGVSTHLEGAQ
jgi:hypothetical protein